MFFKKILKLYIYIFILKKVVKHGVSVLKWNLYVPRQKMRFSCPKKIYKYCSCRHLFFIFKQYNISEVGLTLVPTQ